MPPSSTSNALPKNWPKDITYLTTVHIPPRLSHSILLTSLPPPSLGPQSSSSSPSVLPIISPSPPTPSPLVRVTSITDPSHPAHNQHGLFAARALTPSSFILFYLGSVHDSSTTDPTSNYDLSLDRELDLSIDASRAGNEARFINDYRGVRPDGPNAEFRECLLEVARGQYERRIGVFVLSKGKAAASKRTKGISKGEEILVSYGKGFWTARTVDDSIPEVIVDGE